MLTIDDYAERSFILFRKNKLVQAIALASNVRETLVLPLSTMVRIIYDLCNCRLNNLCSYVFVVIIMDLIRFFRHY